MKRFTRIAAATTAAAAVTIGTIGAAGAATVKNRFEMVRSDGAVAAGCLPDATAKVTIRSLGPVELMTVKAEGLPANTEFDLFVTQIADAPFGLSWYQGDLETNRKGQAKGQFLGRFSEETFSVAVGSPVVAPVVHDGQFTDADTNPTTAPVHQFHLGIWFDSPTDAAAAGCGDTVTPFNGEHDAGVQILNTGTFPDDAGPLAELS